MFAVLYLFSKTNWIVIGLDCQSILKIGFGFGVSSHICYWHSKKTGLSNSLLTCSYYILIYTFRKQKWSKSIIGILVAVQTLWSLLRLCNGFQSPPISSLIRCTCMITHIESVGYQNGPVSSLTMSDNETTYHG